MPTIEPAEEFECSCGSADFWTHLDETITAYMDGFGDVMEYGDQHDTVDTWNYPYYCSECGKEYSSIPPKSPEDEWIESKKRHYLNTQGNNCPICGSGMIEGGSMDVAGTIAYQDCSCGECGAEWTDRYLLREVEITSYPTDFVPQEVQETPAPAPGIPNPNKAFLNHEDNQHNE